MQCITRHTLNSLYSNEYMKGLSYYPLAVNLDRHMESFDTLNYLSNKVCDPKKTEHLNLSIFDMVTWIYGLKILTKHVSWKWKCKFRKFRKW